VALAAALVILPWPETLVERWYSGGLYPAVQPLLTGASNAVPFALMDLAAGVMVGGLALLVARDTRTAGWRSALARAAGRLVVWAAVLYIAFVAAWGLNYRRVRIEARLPYDEGAVTAEAAARLATVAVDRLNALHAPAHANGWTGSRSIEPALAAAFAQAVRDLGVARPVVVGRPKRTIVDWYFQRAGVSGMTDPLFLETLVAGDLLPFERPFVVAHEWSHLAGLADEGEANLAGWLACLRGSAPDQYSGWLFMYGEAIRAVPARERAAVVPPLGAGPRDDLRAIRDRLVRHVNPQVSAAGWRVYDSYLKVNRVEAGAASYDQVVRLALGLRAARLER
jgi:hypothetical protein